MDPIHPIIPHAPTMPPVAASPGVQRVNRDGARSGADGEPHRRRPPRDPEASGAALSEQGALGPGEVDDDGDNPRPRIDITV